MTDCDHTGNGPCTGGPGTHTPAGTNLVLCRRHYDAYRRENGLEVAPTSRPRYPDGEAIPGYERRRE